MTKQRPAKPDEAPHPNPVRWRLDLRLPSRQAMQNVLFQGPVGQHFAPTCVPASAASGRLCSVPGRGYTVLSGPCALGPLRRLVLSCLEGCSRAPGTGHAPGIGVLRPRGGLGGNPAWGLSHGPLPRHRPRVVGHARCCVSSQSSPRRPGTSSPSATASDFGGPGCATGRSD